MIGWIKDIYQTLFRFARFPCEPETIAIGNPDKSSPVLVTCNFDYTVRHLKNYLEKEQIDCFLLVVNTKGTNVWCAAAEGIFTTETVLAHLKVYNVRELVDHTRLILPQLSVAGVKRKDLKEHGWEGIYGPVYFTDLKEFINNRFTKTRDMQALEYGYWERFKMGLSHAVFCTLVCILPIFLFASDWWLQAIILVWYFAFSMQLIEHFIPIDRLLYKGLILTLPILALVLSYSNQLVVNIQASVGIIALGAYIGFDAQGHSHLGQNQHSGKLTAGIFAFLALFYGGSLLL
ncbi:MAG: hypothetical protein NPINA01_30240 [Nitrospinaceae bacterium]|nr:MAG: hypothetical protein NPINA01_30240 [Nitrospinaceae bacterium]